MGNENSQQAPSIKYGERLDNNVKVKWSKISAQNTMAGRDGHCACSMDKTLYVFGGVTQAEEEAAESNDLLAYDTEKQCWSRVEAKGDLPAPRSAATLAAVGKKLYLFGGLSRHVGWFEGIYMFDTETSSWSKLETSGVGPSPRDKLASAVIADKIYVFGGFGPQGMEDPQEEEDEEEEDDGAQFGWFNDLFLFDPSSKAFSQPLQMNLGVPTPRAACAMCAVNKYLIIFGGRDADARKNDLHIFDTETRKWVTEFVASGCQPEPRSFHTATTVDTRVVVMGGRGIQDQHFADFHVFDSEKKEWLQPSVEGDVPVGRGVHTATVVGDHLVLYGGSSNFNKETMQCQNYHRDIYTVKTSDVMRGGVVPCVLECENQENQPAKANTTSSAATTNPKEAGLATATSLTNATPMDSN